MIIDKLKVFSEQTGDDQTVDGEAFPLKRANTLVLHFADVTEYGEGETPQSVTPAVYGTSDNGMAYAAIAAAEQSGNILHYNVEGLESAFVSLTFGNVTDDSAKIDAFAILV